jgi:hypothetical protein
MFVSGRRMFVPGPAVLVSSLSMLLRLLVLAKIVVVGGLVMMMSGSVVISGGLMMVLTGRMLWGLCQIEFPPNQSVNSRWLWRDMKLCSDSIVTSLFLALALVVDSRLEVDAAKGQRSGDGVKGGLSDGGADHSRPAPSCPGERDKSFP